MLLLYIGGVEGVGWYDMSGAFGIVGIALVLSACSCTQHCTQHCIQYGLRMYLGGACNAIYSQGATPAVGTVWRLYLSV